MKRIKFKILFFLIASAYLFSVLSCEQLSEDYNKPEYENPIKVGVVGDVIIGREIAENIFFGIKMAADEINQYGGVNIDGTFRKIQLIYKDSEGLATSGINVVNELIDEGVKVIIGPTISAVAVEMANKCIENNILMITYSATVPTLSELDDNDLIWRTCPSDAFSGRVMAHYALDSLQKFTGVVLHRNDNFGNAMADVIQEKFESLEGNIIAREYYPTNIDVTTYNYDELIDRLLVFEPDIIFAPVFEEEIGKITQDLWNSELYRQMVVKPTLFLTEGAFPKELQINGQPEVLETIIGISSSTTNISNYLMYKDNYITKYGFTPNTYSEHGYDALYAICYAMLKAQSTIPDNFKLELRSVTQDTTANQTEIVINVNEFGKANILLNSYIEINYDGASGKINFDENGDPSSSFVIWGFDENEEYKEITFYN